VGVVIMNRNPPSLMLNKKQSLNAPMKCPQCSNKSVLDQEIDVSELISLYQSISISIETTLPDTSKIELYRCTCCALGHFSPLIVGNEEFYSSLALNDWYYSHAGKSEYLLAAKWIKGGDKVIDVGAGIGEFAQHMHDDAFFCGLELSSEAVRVAQSLGRNVLKMDITDRHSEFESRFDVVTCFQVLEHLNAPNSLVSSIIKLCKPNGLIIIAVPNNDSFLGTAVNNALNLPPHHLLHWNKQSLLYLAKKNNLQIEAYVEETLQDAHRIGYYYSVLNSIILRISNRKHKLVDYSERNRFISRQIGRFAKLLSIILPRSQAPGHTATIVLRKAKD
jgi:2-polyprenyl-3-methyl-5-hydroxy-6-metoxy-1,4-benzoquinol methylase